MIYVHSGTFTVDEGWMQEKLKAERWKLWKHRSRILMREFGFTVAVSALPISGAMYGLCVSAPDIGRRIQNALLGGLFGFLGSVWGFMAIFLIREFLTEWLLKKLRSVLQRWTPSHLIDDAEDGAGSMRRGINWEEIDVREEHDSRL